MIKINLLTDNSFNEEQMKKLTQAVSIVEQVWGLKKFETAVISQKFSQTSKTSLDVFGDLIFIQKKTLMLILNTVANNSETASTKTVTGVISIQSWYIKSSRLYDLVNTIAHEMCHCPEQGSYTHSFLYNRWIPFLRSRTNSVPYKIGNITQQIASQNSL